MQSYWWLFLSALMMTVWGMARLWKDRKEEVMEHLFRLPLLGDLLKDMELALLFLNLYIYQKSGINIITSMTNISSSHSNFISRRLIVVKNKVSQGQSLGEALKSDGFFPSLVYMNVKKGEMTGNLYQYLYEIYRYYDQKSRDSIEMLISVINPTLLAIAVSYLGLIIMCFILPLYSSINAH